MGRVKTPVWRQWTRGEERILRECWAEYSWRELLRRLPNRTRRAIRDRAGLLSLGPRLQGYLSTDAALTLTGFCQSTFDRMVQMEGIRSLKVWGSGRYRHQVYEEDRLLEAAERFLSRETVLQAAARIGVDDQILGRAVRYFRAKEVGNYRGCLLPPEYDDLLRRWREHCATRYLRAVQNRPARKRT